MPFKMPQMQGARVSRNKEYLDVRCHDEEIEATQQMGYFQRHQTYIFRQAPVTKKTPAPISRRGSAAVSRQDRIATNRSRHEKPVGAALRPTLLPKQRAQYGKYAEKVDEIGAQPLPC
jgi:hypothetical protein